MTADKTEHCVGTVGVVRRYLDIQTQMLYACQIVCKTIAERLHFGMMERDRERLAWCHTPFLGAWMQSNDKDGAPGTRRRSQGLRFRHGHAGLLTMDIRFQGPA